MKSLYSATLKLLVAKGRAEKNAFIAKLQVLALDISLVILLVRATIIWFLSSSVMSLPPISSQM